MNKDRVIIVIIISITIMMMMMIIIVIYHLLIFLFSLNVDSREEILGGWYVEPYIR